MSRSTEYSMLEKLFIWPGEMTSWHFLPITKKIGKELREKYGRFAKGFRSLPVEARIGKTVWQTSIFPEKTSGSYLLPVNVKVRQVEKLLADDEVRFSIVVLV